MTRYVLCECLEALGTKWAQPILNFSYLTMTLDLGIAYDTSSHAGKHVTLFQNALMHGEQFKTFHSIWHLSETFTIEVLPITTL